MQRTGVHGLVLDRTHPKTEPQNWTAGPTAGFLVLVPFCMFFFGGHLKTHQQLLVACEK